MKTITSNTSKGYLIIFAIFLPLLASVVYTTLYSLGLTGLLNKGLTLQYIKEIISDFSYFYSILYSFYIASVSLFISLLLAFFTCWQYYKKPHFFKVVILIIPLTLSPFVIALSTNNILSPTGIIYRLLFYIGITDQTWLPRLVNDNFGIGIIISHIYIVFPIFTLLSIYIFKKESLSRVANQAYFLGASSKYFFWKTFLPFMAKRTRLFMVMYFIFFMNAYEVPLELGQSSQKMITIFITEAMTRFNIYDIPLGYAASLIYTVLLFGIYFFISKEKWSKLW